MSKVKKLIPGIMFVFFITFFSILIEHIPLMAQFNISSLIIAMVLGIVAGNFLKLPSILSYGIQSSYKKSLQIAIILLGFKLSLAQVTEIGFKSLLLIFILTTTTILFSLWMGRKLGLNFSLSMLIAVGSSICGASAIAAVSPVIKTKDRDLMFGVATITIFGTLSMFLFPIFYKLLHLNDLFYAVWVGSSIHEVAQVVAAGFAAGEETGKLATLVKLARVLLIIPIVILLGLIQTKKNNEQSTGKVVIPWFVFGFLGAVMVNSMNIVPKPLVEQILFIDHLLLTFAMAGMGLVTIFEQLRNVGLKPFYLGFFTTLFISIASFLLTSLIF